MKVARFAFSANALISSSGKYGFIIPVRDVKLTFTVIAAQSTITVAIKIKEKYSLPEISNFNGMIKILTDIVIRGFAIGAGKNLSR